jgi:hypothetical protein
MELRLGSHVFSIGDFVIYVADADAAARTAGIAEIEADPDLVARTRLDHPGLPLAVAAPAPAAAHACVEAGAELLVGDHLAEVAAATGAGLVCSEPARAVSAGVRADGLLVEAASVSQVRELARAGHPVLVSSTTTPPAGDESETSAADPRVLAEVSIYGWLGALVFRVRAPDAPDARQALDMIASVKGTRPPSVSRRGLV